LRAIRVFQSREVVLFASSRVGIVFKVVLQLSLIIVERRMKAEFIEKVLELVAFEDHYLFHPLSGAVPQMVEGN